MSIEWLKQYLLWGLAIWGISVVVELLWWLIKLIIIHYKYKRK